MFFFCINKYILKFGKFNINKEIIIDSVLNNAIFMAYCHTLRHEDFANAHICLELFVSILFDQGLQFYVLKLTNILHAEQMKVVNFMHFFQT